MSYDEKWMRRALRCARAAFAADEAPIGAVIVRDGEVVATGRNMREKKRNALLHAEIVAIDRACKRLGAWRLEGCELYVTLEPCPMCMGAILNARLDSVYFGAFDAKAGACGSVVDLNAYPFDHTCAVSGGHMENESAKLLGDFFKRLRKRVKQTITEGISE